MLYEDETKGHMIVFSGRIANELLRKGYTITEVRPDKRNKIKSVFVFKSEHGIEDEIVRLSQDNNVFM